MPPALSVDGWQSQIGDGPCFGRFQTSAKFADLCRKPGVSEGTLYIWKAMLGTMKVSGTKRLKALQNEGLKKPLAAKVLDLAAMKDSGFEKC